MKKLHTFGKVAYKWQTNLKKRKFTRSLDDIALSAMFSIFCGFFFLHSTQSESSDERFHDQRLSEFFECASDFFSFCYGIPSNQIG